MLTSRQIIYRDYILKQLGFIEDGFLEKYIIELEISAPRYKYLGALPATTFGNMINYGENSWITESDEFKKYELKHNIFVPKTYNILDFLNKEYKTKKESNVKAKSNLNSYISATDISNFTFCPVSFSISKTFDILKIESAYLGTDMHQEKRLINIFPKSTAEGFTDLKKPEMLTLPFINPDNQYFFDEVLASKVIYNGHNNNNEKKYFKSLKGNYVGQPDYIFQNKKDNYFVVEEKFQYESLNVCIDKEKRKFHSNHVNQLISYLHGIADYSIDYGYLVYWKFDFDSGSPFVHSCHIHKIIKSENTRNQIISVYKNLKKFLSTKTLNFEISKRNPYKCANCVSNLICGHKTGKFTTLSFPYSFSYLNTHFVEFPKELKKDYK